MNPRLRKLLFKLLMKIDIKILKKCAQEMGYIQDPYLDKEYIISSIVLANIPELNKMKFDNLENINKYYDYLDYINELRGFNEFNKLYKQLIKNNTIEIINFFDKYNNPPASFIIKANFDNDFGVIFDDGVGREVNFERDENGEIIHSFGDIIGRAHMDHETFLGVDRIKIVNIENKLININSRGFLSTEAFYIIPYEITQFINDFEYKYESMIYNNGQNSALRLIRIRPQDYFIIREFGGYLPNNYRITIIDQAKPEPQMLIYSNNRLCLIPLEKKEKILQVTNKNRYNIAYIKKYINTKNLGYTLGILKKLRDKGYVSDDLRIPIFFVDSTDLRVTPKGVFLH